MKYNPRIHHRRSTRLKGYHYARAGKYFVTLNCYNRILLFGEIMDGKMMLNEFGTIAHQEWLRTPVLRPNVELGEFIVMPDHIHGIIIIKEDVSGWSQHFETSSNQSAFVRGSRSGCNTPRLPRIKASRDCGNSGSVRGVLQPPRTDPESDQGGCNTPRSDSKENIPQSFLSPSQTLGAIIRGYMGTVTSQINKIRNTPGERVWQRRFHDHIIRNKKSYQRISNYIIQNPKNFNKQS